MSDNLKVLEENINYNIIEFGEGNNINIIFSRSFSDYLLNLFFFILKIIFFFITILLLLVFFISFSDFNFDDLSLLL